MNHQVVSKFFNTNVVLVAHGHAIEGLLTDLSHEYGVGIVGVTNLEGLVMIVDGYALSETALVEIDSIDIIRGPSRSSFSWGH